MKLSILTPTVPERAEQLAALTEKLAKQIGSLPVEHLVFGDNRRRSIGQKRQALLSAALGDYIAFVDDDDDVSDDYVASILEATQTQPDCITFEQAATYNGQSSRVIFGGRNNDEPFQPGGDTLRGPWHVCAWRRRLVADCWFGPINYSEDAIWCAQARRRVKSFAHIPRILHHYRHDSESTLAPEPPRG